MKVLLGVISLFALLSLVVAVIQGMAVLRLAPGHERLASFMPLGWWKFRQLAAKAGPAAAEPLNIYKRAVIAFLVFLVLGVILSGWTVNQRPAPATAAAIVPQLTDSVAYAFSYDLRRAAMMPGAQLLES
jgi:hypothetical protein